MINTQIVNTFDQLALHANEWNQLAETLPQSSPIISYAWVSSYFKHCLSERESWFVVFAYEKEKLAGILPLKVCPKKFFGFERLILCSPDNWDTLYGDIISYPGTEEVIFPILLEAAKNEYPEHVYIQLTYISNKSPTISLFQSGKLNIHNYVTVNVYGAYLPISGNFNDFRSRLSKNFRSNLNKAANKLKKLPDVKTNFLIGDEADTKSLSSLVEVEEKSWKGDVGTSISKSATLLGFYQTLTERLAQTGWLEWHFLHAEDKVIAGNLAVYVGDTILVWKLGYDNDYAKCSPGSILLEKLVERAYEMENVKEINLMTDMPWYDNWNMERRPYYDLRIYSSGLIPALQRTYDHFKAYIKEKPLFRKLIKIIRK